MAVLELIFPRHLLAVADLKQFTLDRDDTGNNMNSEQVKNIVMSDVQSIKHRSMDSPIKEEVESYNRLLNLLIQPIKKEFIKEDTYNSIKSERKEVIEFWVILEDDQSHYCIVYNDKNNEYGLAMMGNGSKATYIGVTGNLLYVFNAM